MTQLTLIPAIDLKDGRCVRLTQGRFEDETVYGDDPVVMAKRWVSEGTQWLHLVNLDGSLGHEKANRAAIEAIVALSLAKIQLGGGIRTLTAIETWLDAGVDRLILGTLVCEDPRLVEKACAQFPGRLAASLDSVGSRLRIRGWLADGGQDVLTVAATLKDLGLSLVIHTDVERDGTQLGPNLPLAAEVARLSGLPTLVAGGVAGPQDLEALKNLAAPGIIGAISGRALYEGALSLAQARLILGN
ncbi:MAG: 1-(5-phosphoribosyl)-5-[(5-phosphoribosylamino)methylideneamino] imidazole-4-carboxamide isomerase [Deltaproteobacteria bacterium]|nr:1-(5-phosphoribosyl)-5-[(5-phosphoribosylamino)methylideneamino] imidazole-4-carboxamide isomerase [Deltaproteobacteria bacterium]